MWCPWLLLVLHTALVCSDTPIALPCNQLSCLFCGHMRVLADCASMCAQCMSSVRMVYHVAPLITHASDHSNAHGPAATACDDHHQSPHITLNS
jgi:hypothetical protein